MKKQWKLALLIVCAATMIFAACGGKADELTLEAVKEAYDTVSQATKVEESIEIKQAKIVQYSERKEYALSGDTYTVTGSTKTLNGLEADDAYTLAEIETYTVNKAEAFTGALGLSEANVESATAEDGKLTVSVKAGKEKDFFNLQTLADVSSMQAVFAVTSSRLDEVVVTYTSGTSTVTVSIAFTY